MLRGRGARITGLVLLAGAGLALGGCQTSEQRSASEITAIGFEGFIGVPQPVGEHVARELVRAADGRRFSLVSASDRTARYLMRGYLAPASEGGTVAYVWDLFDRSGQRTQRLSGDVRLPPGDPWAALSNGAARPLALASAGAIDAFVQRPSQPAAQPGGGQAQPAAAAQPATAAPAQTAAAAPQAEVAAFAPPAARRPAGRRVVVEAVAGLEPAEAGVLAAAMRRALTELGYLVEPPGTRGDYVLTAEVALNPPAPDGRILTIAWQVADGAGRTLGEIRQMARVPDAAMARDGVAAFARAVEAALPGLVALAPPR